MIFEVMKSRSQMTTSQCHPKLWLKVSFNKLKTDESKMLI